LIQVDYTSAAAAYGSASANSFRVMLSAAVEKVRDIEGNGGVPLASPTKSRGGGGGGKKRKADSDDAADDGSPAAKRKARPASKKTNAESADDDGELSISAFELLGANMSTEIFTGKESIKAEEEEEE